jgi:hypothetical protein
MQYLLVGWNTKESSLPRFCRYFFGLELWVCVRQQQL